VLARQQAIGSALAAALAVFLSPSFYACSDSPPATTASDGTVPITLPDGEVIRAELASTPAEQARGLMFRRELAPGRGMIFHFPDSRPRPFWMYQTLIPLDIVWMNEQGVIVEISADTPPCGSTDSGDCPNYGGTIASQYVLELAAGQAAAHQLKVGGRIRF
jgi:hypothetical protein